jgi:two-component system osmolarity sensor histidine kinase EnvZ
MPALSSPSDPGPRRRLGAAALVAAGAASGGVVGWTLAAHDATGLAPQAAALALSGLLGALGLAAWRRPSQPARDRPVGSWPATRPAEAPDRASLEREIRDINAGLRRMSRELARAENDRVLMLAGISHDLRTPLARLRLELELSVPCADARRHMAADIDQMDRLIAQFLQYARPTEPRLATVPLRAAVQAAVEPFVGGARLSATVDVDPALAVQADPVDVERALQNLLENAARYARPAEGGPARVDIGARADEGTIRLELRDHGPGVPESQLDRLTTPFYRGDTARTAASGAGLGLAIVQRLARRLGGNLRLAHAPGGGLRAELSLPRAQPGLPPA